MAAATITAPASTAATSEPVVTSKRNSPYWKTIGR
jgi:hypothetical protein